jgi:hypothetical protein
MPVRRSIAALSLLALAACSKPEPSPAQQEARDTADIAAVEAVQNIPPTPEEPGPILYPDIDKYKLFGAACAFVPSGGGIAPVVLAQEKSAYMKLDGQIVRFAPDPGSPKLPVGAHGKYDAKAWSITLDIAEGEGRDTTTDAVDFNAHFTLRNDHDQAVYDANGTARCGA